MFPGYVPPWVRSHNSTPRSSPGPLRHTNPHPQGPDDGWATRQPVSNDSRVVRRRRDVSGFIDPSRVKHRVRTRTTSTTFRVVEEKISRPEPFYECERPGVTGVDI